MEKELRVALCCIAKDEDNYIGEWADYYLTLGVDDIFIYQNDWRWKQCPSDSRIHLIEFDGSCKLLPAYNDFIANNSRKYDFGCVFDVDEFLAIRGGIGIKAFLGRFSAVPAVSVNWRIYGDGGLYAVEDGDYSLLRRFTKCGAELNHHVKQIINFGVVGGRCSFINPHFITVDGMYVRSRGCDGSDVVGPFNENLDVSRHSAFINHYMSKTREEWNTNRVTKGKCDFHRNDPRQSDGRTIADFDKWNINDVEDTTALDFYTANGGIS